MSLCVPQKALPQCVARGGDKNWSFGGKKDKQRVGGVSQEKGKIKLNVPLKVTIWGKREWCSMTIRTGEETKG